MNIRMYIYIYTQYIYIYPEIPRCHGPQCFYPWPNTVPKCEGSKQMSLVWTESRTSPRLVRLGDRVGQRPRWSQADLTSTQHDFGQGTFFGAMVGQKSRTVDMPWMPWTTHFASGPFPLWGWSRPNRKLQHPSSSLCWEVFWFEVATGPFVAWWGRKWRPESEPGAGKQLVRSSCETDLSLLSLADTLQKNKTLWLFGELSKVIASLCRILLEDRKQSTSLKCLADAAMDMINPLKTQRMVVVIVMQDASIANVYTCKSMHHVYHYRLYYS